MRISYRTRSFLKRTGIWLAVLGGIILAVLIYGILESGKYVLYSRDGVKLDYSLSSQDIQGQVAVKPQIENPIDIYYNEGENAVSTSKELEQLLGYYVTAAELENDIQAVSDKIQSLPKGTPVMMEVKSKYGNFFYSSTVSANRNEDMDIAAMDQLIRQVTGDYYTIACLPGLRDMKYGLDHTEDGMAEAGGWLYFDPEGCYWLDPTSDGTVNYLVAIATELKNLGFDEVVFSDYYFPATDRIVFKGDKAEALAKTAQTLVNTCTTEGFAVSFVVQSEFAVPSGRSRLYLTGTAAAEAQAVAEQFGLEDPQIRVVFLTTVHDTRFDDYGVLRPIADAE